ncbi:acyl-CoA dehydrogenase family protein [Jatrophihabitans sp. DSM 45814]
MTLVLTEEQIALRASLREFLDDKAGEADLRRLSETPLGYDPEVWSQLATMGIQGLAIAEEYGGSGASFIELGIAVEEAGRSLLSAPLLSTAVLAAGVLVASRDEEAKLRHLPRIADGTCVMALAIEEAIGGLDLSQLSTTAVRDGGRWLLSGTKDFVIDGFQADAIIVVAGTTDGVGLFEVAADAEGLTRTPLITMDATRKQARIDLAQVPATRIGNAADAASAIPYVLDVAAVALAMEQVGGMQYVLETAVAYAQTRFQFGRAIGSFQAVKHRCADMLIKVELARSAAYFALWSAVNQPEDFPAAASLSKSYCSEAYFDVARNNIMVHGGIGFTWEHSAQLFYKRAKSDLLLFGTPTAHNEALLQRLGV